MPKHFENKMHSSKHSSVEEANEAAAGGSSVAHVQNSARSLEPVFPERSDDMIVSRTSASGVVEVSELSFRLNEEFRASSYILVCKDVTPGLPPRMQMKHTKILVKLIDLDPPPSEE